MEIKSVDDYESVDEIILFQTTRKNNILHVLSLVQDRKFLNNDFIKALNLLTKIKTDIKTARQEIESTRLIIQKLNDLEISAEELESRMNYMELNLPGKFNKLVYLDEFNDDKENTIDEDIPSTPLPPIRRYLNFSESKCLSAQKQVVHPEIPYLTQTEFRAIPEYMRGRMKSEIINSFIDKMNQCIIDKYSLLNTPRSALKKHSDIEKNTKYKSQECVKTKGKRFITQDDLKIAMGGKLDRNTLKSLIPMLRHSGRLQEVLEGGLLRYVVMNV